MRDLVTFAVGLSVGLVIVVFSVKAERDGNTISNLKNKNITMTQRINELESQISEKETENESLKQDLNRTERLFKGF